VAKVISEPWLMPVAFAATSRKWYVVADGRPESAAVTPIAGVPELRLTAGALDPYEVDFPYWK
jgi:hypothetical protein